MGTPDFKAMIADIPEQVRDDNAADVAWFQLHDVALQTAATMAHQYRKLSGPVAAMVGPDDNALALALASQAGTIGGSFALAAAVNIGQRKAIAQRRSVEIDDELRELTRAMLRQTAILALDAAVTTIAASSGHDPAQIVQLLGVDFVSAPLSWGIPEKVES